MTTVEFGRLTKLSFDPMMKKATKKLVNRSNITTALHLSEEKKEKLKGFRGLNCVFFIGKKHFDDDELPRYLIFQPVLK